MSDGEITISELARWHDATLRALRFYEEKGLLKPRREGTKRFYPPLEALFAGEIVMMRAAGLTIQQIGTMRSTFMTGSMDEYHGALAKMSADRVKILEKELAAAKGMIIHA